MLGFVLGGLLWIAMSAFGDPAATWIAVATAASLGMWVTLPLRPIAPGQELGAIAA